MPSGFNGTPSGLGEAHLLVEQAPGAIGIVPLVISKRLNEIGHPASRVMICGIARENLMAGSRSRWG
jgi:hypothetical protein